MTHLEKTAVLAEVLLRPEEAEEAEEAEEEGACLSSQLLDGKKGEASLVSGDKQDETKSP